MRFKRLHFNRRRISELAILATVLEFDEPAPLVVIIVNHGSCTCSDDLRHNRIKLSIPSLGIAKFAVNVCSSDTDKMDGWSELLHVFSMRRENFPKKSGIELWI
jgi:hypothetical protein